MNCSVKLLPAGEEYSVVVGSLLYDVIKENRMEFPCGGKGLCGKCKVKLISGEISLDEKHKQKLEKLGLSEEWRLACYSRVFTDITIEIYGSDMMNIQFDNSSFKYKPEKGYGIAVDLGSTTIVLQLIDLSTGTILGTRCSINPQSHYGADIISRISYSMESLHNEKTLMWLVREHIGSEISKLVSDVDKCRIKVVTIAGNTVMHHLFSGIDVSPLAISPFNSPNNNSQLFSSSCLGWDLPSDCQIEFLPNLSHFVGSDIMCGIMACNMLSDDGASLLVDLGTNGEIALVCNNRIFCTSTAAGPAFEGLNISCGMRATSGAVYSLDFVNNNIDIKTINNVPAKGVCGSGLIEIIHFLLESGRIDSTGALTDESDSIEIVDGIRLTIADIREFQLAKSALSTGISMILNKNNVMPKDINNVYVTGGLGNYLNIHKIKKIGLFCEFDDKKIHKIGNASLAGCRELLFKSNRKNISRIIDNCSFCALENYSDFQDIFCENLFFNNASL